MRAGIVDGDNGSIDTEKRDALITDRDRHRLSGWEIGRVGHLHVCSHVTVSPGFDPLMTLVRLMRSCCSHDGHAVETGLVEFWL